jgi:hypothetical protein
MRLESGDRRGQMLTTCACRYLCQVGLILRIKEEDLAKDHVIAAGTDEDWWTGTLYGDLLWVLLMVTAVPLLFALLYKSDVQKAQNLLNDLAKADSNDLSTLGQSRQQLQVRPSVLPIIKPLTDLRTFSAVPANRPPPH